MRHHVTAWIALSAALCVPALPGCRAGAGPEVAPLRPISEVIAAHADAIMAIDGVAGIYEGRQDDGTPCIRIMVVRLDDALRARLPRTLEGHPVEIEETGEIRAMPGDSSG